MLTWTHPRASGVILLTSITAIVSLRLLDIPRLVLRGFWIGLLVSIGLESVGRLALHQPLISQFQTSFQIQKSTVDVIAREFQSLANYIVVEAQRLLFAKNIRHSSIAFVVTFTGYQLLKVLPIWILSIIAVLIAFSAPPAYLANQELIDSYLSKATELTSTHFENAKNVASKNVEVYSEKARVAAVDIGAKAGVDVNKFLAPGPVIVDSDSKVAINDDNPDELTPVAAKSTTNGTHEKVDIKAISEELSRAPEVPNSQFS